MLVVDGVEMLDVREAAERAGRTPETIRRWVWGGRVSSTKHGNRILVPRAEIEATRGSDSPQRHGGGMTLAAWAELVTRDRRGGAGVTAADLIWEDRAGR